MLIGAAWGRLRPCAPDPTRTVRALEEDRRMILASIHPGLTLSQFEDDRSLAEDCRRFCLRTIRSTYGYDYRPEWHDDLDSLREPAACHYTASNRGVFFVLRDADGHVVG